MNVWQEKVQEFHESTGSTVGDYPELRDRELRAKLIMEEAVETVAALGFRASALIDEEGIPGERAHREVARFARAYQEPNFEDAIDGWADLIYVILGSAVAAGIDLDPFITEVHRANMAKLAGPKREDGKQLKPKGWTPPDITAVLIEQQTRAEAWRSLRRAGGVEVLA